MPRKQPPGATPGGNFPPARKHVVEAIEPGKRHATPDMPPGRSNNGLPSEQVVGSQPEESPPSARPDEKYIRASRREILATVARYWQPIRLHHSDDNCELILYGSDVIAHIDWPKLRRRLTGEDLALIQTLIRELIHQSQMAEWALPVAGAELDVHSKRKAGTRKSVEQAKRRVAVADAGLEAKAKELLKRNASLSYAEIGRRLAERHALGNADYIAAKLRKLMRKKIRR